MITVEITNGPSFSVPWTSGMNAENALQLAYNSQGSQSLLTYATQFYGSNMGNLVIMVNETYESFPAKASYLPFYYWEFLVNGQPSVKGVDFTILNDNDIVTFTFTPISAAVPKQSTIHVKHSYKTGLI